MIARCVLHDYLSQRKGEENQGRGEGVPSPARQIMQTLRYSEQRWVGEVPSTLDLTCISPDPRFHSIYLLWDDPSRSQQTDRTRKALKNRTRGQPVRLAFC